MGYFGLIVQKNGGYCESYDGLRGGKYRHTNCEYGEKVKIVDVEKQKKKRKFIKQWIIASAASLVLILSCFQIVRMENQEVLLNKQVYKLASQIDVLEKENLALKKQEADVTISYDDLFARAKSLGMKFPTNCQVQTYTVEKSTAVRLYGEKNHKLGK